MYLDVCYAEQEIGTGSVFTRAVLAVRYSKASEAKIQVDSAL